jgi:hypothetical protein
MREGPRVTCAAPGDVSLVSAVDAAGVRPDDGASSDCRAARASAAGTVDAFGAHDGVRFGNERDAPKVARTNNKAFIVLSLVPAAFRAAVSAMLTTIIGCVYFENVTELGG